MEVAAPMTAVDCAIDGRPTEDGWICSGCTSRAARHLTEIITLTPDARSVAYGEVRRTAGASSGKPGSRSPGNDDALDTLNEIQNRLTTTARDIAETRGLQIDSAGLGDLSPADPLTLAAKWLGGQLEWLRHAVDGQGEAYAVGVFEEIGECAARMRSLVNGPAAQRYLGPCGAPLIAIDPDVAAEQGIHPANAALGLAPCDGDVYGPDGGTKGRCRTCGATVDQAERRAWLTEQVRDSDLAWTASGIADALNLNVNTIRTWAHERRSETGMLLRAAKLSTFWRNEAGQLVPWVEPPAQLTEAQRKAEIKARGDRLHYVADVTALAREAAERRAQREARTEGAAA
jgi:hypothetical protein